MKIKNGNNFTLCLTDRGEVYSWGKNNYGQLGIDFADIDSEDIDYHKPTKIDFKLDIPIRYISAGFNYAAAIDYDYNVYIWGINNNGQLGLGDKVNRYSPIIIEKLTEKKVEKIYCRSSHTFVLTQEGEVYSWGNNNFGNLGIENNNNNNVKTPTKLNFPNNTIIKKLYIGDYPSFAIDICSNIYFWGGKDIYQTPEDNNRWHKPPSIANMLENFNIDKIVCLTFSTIILADNKLYYIGNRDYPELGLSIKETREITLIKERVENVWGDRHTVFCKMCNGDIYAWGKNENGQLGIGNTINQNNPVKLNITLDIKSINYKYDVAYAITTSGEIYTWGLNELVNKKSILEPTLFTYFLDNDIEVKSMNRTKSARKN